MSKPTVVDLFCGGGGFSEGFRMKGFDIVFALDNWKAAILTHKLNHPDCQTAQMDILELDTPEKIDEVIPDVDIIIGSPPCVSFSGSNKAGKADKTLGIKLIEAQLRIVLWKKSKGKLKYWILENVPNATKFIKDRYTWGELGLPGKGPSLEIRTRKIMNSADYGVCQTRKRLFLGDYPAPPETHQSRWVDLKHILESLTDPSDFKKDYDIVDPNYPKLKIKSKELTDHFYDTRVEEFEWKNAKRLKEDHGFMGKMSFPENIERPSRTVMATRSASTREAMILAYDKVTNEFRMPTIREIASIMSFPITYQFEGNSENTKYKLVGNAVCPKLISAIAESIAKDFGMKVSSGYLFPKTESRPSLNLNGMKHERRKEKPKRFSSKFAVHVPYLKIRGFRVELSNVNSDFDKENINWDCVLHQGSGKDAKKCSPKYEDIKRVINIWNRSRLKNDTSRFNEFTRDINNMMHRMPDSTTFQKLYCGLTKNDKFLNPMEFLEEIGKAVDKNYPAGLFEKVTVDNINRIIPIKKDNIPLRIMMALFACKSLTNRIRENDNS